MPDNNMVKKSIWVDTSVNKITRKT
jgi:hypothetical protein